MGKKTQLLRHVGSCRQEVGRQATKQRNKPPRPQPDTQNTSKQHDKQHRARQQRKREGKETKRPLLLCWLRNVCLLSVHSSSISPSTCLSVSLSIVVKAIPERQPRTTYRAQKKTPHEQPTHQPTRVKVTHCPLIPRNKETSAVSLDQCDRQYGQASR